MKLSHDSKKAIIFLSSIVGNLGDKQFWGGLFVTQQTKDKAKEIVKQANEIIDSLDSQLANGEYTQLAKDIKKGIYSMEVITNYEIIEKLKQVRKMPVKIQKEHRDDLIEIALNNCCNCQRNIKHCDQRKLFKKMSIEAYDPDKTDSKCEYWYKGVRV